jgi:hypothetical protein
MTTTSIADEQEYCTSTETVRRDLRRLSLTKKEAGSIRDLAMQFEQGSSQELPSLFSSPTPTIKSLGDFPPKMKLDYSKRSPPPRRKSIGDLTGYTQVWMGHE